MGGRSRQVKPIQKRRKYKGEEDQKIRREMWTNGRPKDRKGNETWTVGRLEDSNKSDRQSECKMN